MSMHVHSQTFRRRRYASGEPLSSIRLSSSSTDTTADTNVGATISRNNAGTKNIINTKNVSSTKNISSTKKSTNTRNNANAKSIPTNHPANDTNCSSTIQDCNGNLESSLSVAKVQHEDILDNGVSISTCNPQANLKSHSSSPKQTSSFSHRHASGEIVRGANSRKGRRCASLDTELERCVIYDDQSCQKFTRPKVTGHCHQQQQEQPRNCRDKCDNETNTRKQSSSKQEFKQELKNVSANDLIHKSKVAAPMTRIRHRPAEQEADNDNGTAEDGRSWQDRVVVTQRESGERIIEVPSQRFRKRPNQDVLFDPRVRRRNSRDRQPGAEPLASSFGSRLRLDYSRRTASWSGDVFLRSGSSSMDRDYNDGSSDDLVTLGDSMQLSDDCESTGGSSSHQRRRSQHSRRHRRSRCGSAESSRRSSIESTDSRMSNDTYSSQRVSLERGDVDSAICSLGDSQRTSQDWSTCSSPDFSSRRSSLSGYDWSVGRLEGEHEHDEQETPDNRLTNSRLRRQQISQIADECEERMNGKPPIAPAEAERQILAFEHRRNRRRLHERKEIVQQGMACVDGLAAEPADRSIRDSAMAGKLEDGRTLSKSISSNESRTDSKGRDGRVAGGYLHTPKLQRALTSPSLLSDSRSDEMLGSCGKWEEALARRRSQRNQRFSSKPVSPVACNGWTEVGTNELPARNLGLERNSFPPNLNEHLHQVDRKNNLTPLQEGNANNWRQLKSRGVSNFYMESTPSNLPQERFQAKSKLKKYDRNFLLNLQFCEHAMKKPCGLPKFCESILVDRQKAVKCDSTHVSSHIPKIPVRKNVTIKRCPNPWKLGIDKKFMQEEEQISMVLFGKLRSLLNKLTPEKYEVIVAQIKNLQIDTDTKLHGVVKTIHEKAMNEPNFANSYAKLSSELTNIATKSGGETLWFNDLLLDACREQFLQKTTDSIKSKIEQQQDRHESEDKLVIQEHLERKHKEKIKCLGNVSFIGELYQLYLLNNDELTKFIKILIKNGDSLSMESLCHLLAVAGPVLEARCGVSILNQCFWDVEHLISSNTTEPRVRFLLLNLVELRENGWKGRQQHEAPKTLREIHADIAAEETEKEAMLQRGRRNRGRDSLECKFSSKEERKLMNGSICTEKRRKKGSQEMLNTKMSAEINFFSCQTSAPSTPNCSNRNRRMSTPGRTHSDHRPSQSQQDLRQISDHCLGGRNDVSDRQSALSAARALHRSSSCFSPNDRVKDDQDEIFGEVFSKSKGIPTSNSFSQNSHHQKLEGSFIPSNSPIRKESCSEMLTRTEIESKIISMADEFLIIKDYQEADQCIKDLHLTDLQHLVVLCCISHSFEKNCAYRHQIGLLLCHLLHQKTITVECFSTAIEQLFEDGDDFELDIPLVWNYAAQIFGPLIASSEISFALLIALLRNFKGSIKVYEMAAMILREAVESSNEETVKTLLAKVPFIWEKLDAPHAEIMGLLQSYNLQFLMCVDALKSSEFSRHLSYLLTETCENNKIIIAWINSHQSTSHTRTGNFIQILVTSVVCSALKDGSSSHSCVVKVDILKKRQSLLQNYINKNFEFEHETLVALQCIATSLEHPPGLLRKLFDFFYDEEIISEESFVRWKETDSSEPGKEMAVHSVTSFFTWLNQGK